MTAPSFNTPAGQIIGWRDGSIIRATGIRYARAGRFQPPVAEPPAQTSIHATEWAPACAQADHPFGVTIIESTLRDADLVAGLTWSEVNASGRKVRELWSLFAKTGELRPGLIEPNVLNYSRV